MIQQIVIWICDDCLAGVGDECHTAGCALFFHSVDLAIDENMYTVIGAREEYLPPKESVCQHSTGKEKENARD